MALGRATQSCTSKLMAELAVDPTEERELHDRVALLRLRGGQLLALHEFEEAARCFRLGTKIDSSNPHFHYGLGCALWPPAFENHRRVPASWPEDIEEAKRELWLAAQLAEAEGPRWGLPTTWDLPLVELGWILLESGLLSDAQAHAAVIKTRLRRHTALSAYFAGQVHEAAGLLGEAISAYEDSLRRDSRFQLSRESLARCRTRQKS